MQLFFLMCRLDGNAISSVNILKVHDAIQNALKRVAAEGADRLKVQKAMEERAIAGAQTRADEEVKAQLLSSTNLKAGEAASTRIAKINDAMDTIGQTTSCRPWFLCKDHRDGRGRAILTEVSLLRPSAYSI